METLAILALPLGHCDIFLLLGSTYNLKRMCDDSDSHQLLSVIATVHHEGVGEAFDNWALRLSESLRRISTCAVGDIDWSADLDIIAVDAQNQRQKFVRSQEWLTSTRYL